MNIPDKVKIGYKDYKVNMHDGNLVDDNQVCYGTIEYDSEIINISNLYSDNSKKCTLIHECVHGIDEFLDIGLSEEQVTKLGKGIYDFIRDNQYMFIEDKKS